MIMIGGEEDREEEGERREGYMERIRGGNGGAAIRIAFSLGREGGGERGNTLLQYLQYFFLCDIR